MAQQYLPGLFDRLMDDDAHSGAAWTVEQLKDAVARDLEALLNTRAALPDGALAAYTEAGASVLAYGLIDFAGMCLTSDDDQKIICAAVQRAIERHEPRLAGVSASLRLHGARINRVDFIISARLRASAAPEAVQFDAVLQPSTQQYAIRNSRVLRGETA